MWGVLLLYLWCAAEKKTLREIALPPLLVAVFAMLTIAPDLVRNYRIFHAFVLICNTGGLTLWTGNNPQFNPGAGDALLHNSQLEMMIRDPRTELQADQLAERMAITYIRDHPRRTAQLAIPKLRALYARDDGPIMYAFGTNDATRVGRAVKWVNRGYYYALLLTALAGVLVSIRRSGGTRSSAAWVFVLLAILYYTVPFTILPSYDRYHDPALPYFAVFSGAAASALVLRILSRTSHPRVAAVRS
jgi:hypothetical protein